MKLVELVSLSEGYEHISFWINTRTNEFLETIDPHAMMIAKNPEKFGVDPSIIPQPVDWDNPEYDRWHDDNDDKFGPLYMTAYKHGWIRGFFSHNSQNVHKSGEVGISAPMPLIQKSEKTFKRIIHRYKPSGVRIDTNPGQTVYFQWPSESDKLRDMFGWK